ncbi:MAG: NifB/NifX family molybdenum-iron cluster-binding protein [Desulfurivibrio sp.]|nr:NifB/NifX family molybdenum-iron cluster-binding protein [Desulfurivibrio sp.]
MEKLRIATPTNNPGGLGASRSEHFGHCDIFTLVDLVDNQVAGVETINNAEHGAGGCLIPVEMLQQQGVKALLAGGMGKRPLQACKQAGIEVYFAAPSLYPDVQKVIDAWLAGQLTAIDDEQLCQGNCHH